MKNFTITLLSVFVLGTSHAEGIFDSLPSISAGAGILIFNGDLGKSSTVSSYSRIRAGYNIAVEQRVGDMFGLAFTGVLGNLVGSEYSQTYNANFKSKVTQADLSFFVHTDRLFENISVTPYASTGIGFLAFDPYGDLYDKYGKLYNYWSDGSIRDKVEPKQGPSTASILVHDYNYETQLKDKTVNYASHTLIVPLTLGFNFKIVDNFDARLGATYFYSFSDYIDNVKVNSNNDAYVYMHVTLAYRLMRIKRKIEKVDDKRYDDIDFDKIGDELHIPKQPQTPSK